MFKELNYNKSLKFYLFKFHNIFDGLIGLDNSKLLNTRIDFTNATLYTQNSAMKIEYLPFPQNFIYKLIIDHTVPQLPRFEKDIVSSPTKPIMLVPFKQNEFKIS